MDQVMDGPWECGNDFSEAFRKSHSGAVTSELRSAWREVSWDQEKVIQRKGLEVVTEVACQRGDWNEWKELNWRLKFVFWLATNMLPDQLPGYWHCVFPLTTVFMLGCWKS